uniref:Uncharacterized protein n=1 Tax=Trichogramma kaykai TaxID=54128 RepID=A0ABD2W5F6_9HYME
MSFISRGERAQRYASWHSAYTRNVISRSRGVGPQIAQDDAFCSAPTPFLSRLKSPSSASFFVSAFSSASLSLVTPIFI